MPDTDSVWSDGDSVAESELATSPLFAGLPHAVLAECARRARPVVFPRGAVLAREGDRADAFYVLLNGRVEVVLEQPGEADDFIDVLGRGDCIGDLALLLGQERTATVRALRECRTACISKDDFSWLMQQAPEFTVRLARTIAERLQRTTHRKHGTRPVERILVLLAAGVASAEHWASALQEELVFKAGRAGHAPPSFSVMQATQASLDENSLQALRDADAVLFLGDAEGPPDNAMLRSVLDAAAEFRPQPHVHLVLLHGKEPPHRGTLAWLRDRRIHAWHHLGPGTEDLGQLVRRVTGRAVGLVLSGGGARGFAHIGVIRAFAEAGIPIDFIAGSSMGAIVAAQHAMGFDFEAMLGQMRRSYVGPRSVKDFAIPYVAIHTGVGTNAELKAMFGERRIEDLRTPYFAVSSDLSTAETVVHATGKVWHAARSSCSVPGLLPPVRSRGGFLVDGGLLDNLPVAAMRERCEGRIVASDVSVAVEFQRLGSATRRPKALAKYRPPRRMPGIRQILMRTVQLASVRDARRAGVPADLYLHTPVDDVGMTDFHRLEEIVERGADYARKQLAGWKR